MFKRIKRVLSAARRAWTDELPESVNSFDYVTVTGLKDIHLSGWTLDTGELVKGFLIRPEDILLDIGCNSGGYALYSARQGAEIILADVDAEQLEIARARLEAIPARRVQTLVTDANPIPLPDASVTRVVAMEVLEHVEDPAQFMSELVRVAKPGALFLFTVPDEVVEGVQKLVAPPVYFEKPNHIRIFKRGELEQLALDAGLVIEHRLQYGFYHAVWWSLFWACPDQPLSAPWHFMLESWARTWSSLLDQPKGMLVKAALDEVMPKSRVIVARKP
ncbi:MAG TPA: class I SAM-dependent methyltransferase [Pseudomonas sp.]|nr:class I SAM-dependent methyltransferase [Pseudomonas sp.]